MILDRGTIMADYGSGHLYQRGSTWWIQYYAHGKRHRESAETEIKQVARKLLNRRLVEYAGRAANIEEPTYEVGEQRIREHYDENNKSNVNERLKHLRPFFKGTDLATITTARLRAYRRHRKREGAARATVNRELACLRTMMNLLRRDGLNLTVPHVPMAKERNVRTGFVDEPELQAVMSHLPDRLHGLVEFAYVTGWRKGEVLSLTWANVGRDSVRLEPGTTKNDEGREFPLIPRLRAVIERQRERMGDRVGGPLWFYDNGKPIRDFRGAWKKAVEAAGLPDLLFHDLRRSAVRNLVRAGIPKHTAKALTGHKTDAVFDRYDIVDSARLHEQASKLEAFYGEQEQKVRAIK